MESTGPSVLITGSPQYSATPDIIRDEKSPCFSGCSDSWPLQPPTTSISTPPRCARLRSGLNLDAFRSLTEPAPPRRTHHRNRDARLRQASAGAGRGFRGPARRRLGAGSASWANRDRIRPIASPSIPAWRHGARPCAHRRPSPTRRCCRPHRQTTPARRPAGEARNATGTRPAGPRRRSRA